MYKIIIAYTDICLIRLAVAQRWKLSKIIIIKKKIICKETNQTKGNFLKMEFDFKK